MYLRKLTISGFKSFADSIEVEFDQGVTGVIGPNGCGKSNISDSIRWVLGEQNPRRLRGQVMTDMIFNGTASRPAAGVAEVSLIFENEDGFLPVSYKEVAITRRLYRNGDSEYLINQTKCRLKDITDLFLDSGIGTNAYSLMEQGRVDMIVNARPTERRAILEEAAGVSRFLNRQMEAMRKLERTEVDLNRLADILGELQRRKRSLERQARQAELARKYRRELQQVEYILHMRSGKTLYSSLEELENKLKGLAVRIQALEGELSEVRSRKQALNERLEEQETVHRTHRDKYASTTARLEQTERQINDLRTRGTEYAQLRTRLLEESKADGERMQEENKRLEHATAEIERLADAIEAIEKTLHTLGEEHQSINETYTNAEREGQSRREAFQQAERSINELQNQQRLWERDHEFFTARLEKLNQEQQEISSEIETVVARMEKLCVQKGELETQRAECETRFNEKNTLLQERIQEEATTRKQWQETERSWQKAHSRWESLRDLQAKLAGFDEGVRLLLRGDNGKTNPSLLGTLAEHIRADEGFERAVDAALAQKLQAIVVEDLEAITTSIATLRDREKGRVVFLPRNGFTHAVSIDVPAELQAFPTLLNHIQCEDTWKDLLQRLLGRVLLVETLDQAMQIRQHLIDGIRLVTRDGDVIEADGTVTGGHIQASQILRRTQEIAQLEQEHKRLDESRHHLEQRTNELQKDIQGLTADRDELKQNLHDLTNQRRVVADEITRSQNQSERLKKNETALTAELETITTKLTDGASSAEKRALELEAASSRRDTLQQELDEWSSSMNETQLRRKAIQDQMSETRMALMEQQKDRERWQGETETLSRHLRELQRGIDEKQRLAEQQEERQAETQHQVTSTEESIVTLKQEQESVWKQVSECEESAQGIRSEVKKIAREEAALMETYDGLRTQRESVTQDKLKLQVEEEYWRKRMDGEFTGLEDREALERDERTTEELSEKQEFYKRRLSQLGMVNELAIEEYEEVRERCDFLEAHQSDLEKSKANLVSTAKELHGTSVERFMETFEKVKVNFNRTFRRMFNGGRAEIILMDGDPLEAGIEIEVQPPGKKLQSISLLSGGEKALVAVALLFAIYEIKPCPFCFLDEIDAPLDDTNIGRFTSMLRDFLDRSQFIMITHSKKTMEICDALYGVTMPHEGISTVYSMKFQKNNVEQLPAPDDVAEEQGGVEDVA